MNSNLKVNGNLELFFDTICLTLILICIKKKLIITTINGLNLVVQITLNNKKTSPDDKNKSTTSNFRRSIEINFVSKPARKALREKTDVSQLMCHDCQQQQDLPHEVSQEVAEEQSPVEGKIPVVESEVPLHQQPLNELLNFFNLNCKH